MEVGSMTHQRLMLQIACAMGVHKKASDDERSMTWKYSRR
jgi:hypothetical protein